MCKGCRPSIFVDGKMVRLIENGKYFETQLTTGTHTMMTNWDKYNHPPEEFKVIEGQTQYIKVHFESGTFKAGFELIPVSTKEGIEGTKKLKPE